jgi:galactose mutarotase-like enzyme
VSITLRNKGFAARVDEKGAELKSLVHIATGQEHIWHGDPAWWTGSAPILFPIVGSLKGGVYTYQGRQYALPNHGFARGSEFAVIRAAGDFAEFSLSSNAPTRENYPFDFSLRVEFRMTDLGLSVRYVVANTGSERIYFSLGSHPAFVVPFAGGVLENYYVLFDREESARRWFIKDNLLEDDVTQDIFENGTIINLTRTLFDRGALVFKHPRSGRFSLRSSQSPRSLTVVTEGAPYLGIWAKPGAPFVCIEPWHGVTDSASASGNLTEKEGILYLDSGGTFATGYSIEIS